MSVCYGKSNSHFWEVVSQLEDLGEAAQKEPEVYTNKAYFDTPTPEGCGILSSTTTARHAWSDTVSLSVRWLTPPRSRVAPRYDRKERSRDMSSRIQADGLVLATRGSLGSRDPDPSVRLMFYGRASPSQPATSNFQRTKTIIPERHPSFKDVVDFQHGDETPSSHP